MPTAPASRPPTPAPAPSRPVPAARVVGVGALALALLAGAATGCARRPRTGSAEDGDAPAPARGRRPASPMTAGLPDLGAVHARMRLVLPRGDFPWVGAVAHFAARSPDTTLTLLSVSFPNRALSFEREGDRYRAAYQVRVEVRRLAGAPPAGAPGKGATPSATPAAASGALVRQVAADEVVRVATFRETARTDESVIFAQQLALPPGRYALGVSVRDVEGTRSGVAEVTLAVPRLGAGAGTLSTPVVAYRGTPRARLDVFPELLTSPRASAVFGQDSLVAVYVEGYAATAAARLPVALSVRDERGSVVWRDTLALERTGAAPTLHAGVARLPVARLGIGVVTLHLARRDAPADSTSAPLFVSLGDDLPVAGFDELLGYLRYYAAPERLRPLRDSSADARAAAWSDFLRDTDPVSATTVHEGLQEYFARLRSANQRFREDGNAGWLTDRGMAYVALGEPEQIFDPNSPDQAVRGRQQIWEYRDPRVQLVFVDQSGFGRWRLTPASMVEVQAALRRRMVR